MNKFIVIDKQEGFSWVNNTIEDVIDSMGYDSEVDIWNDIKEQVKHDYEVIVVNGDIKYL